MQIQNVIIIDEFHHLYHPMQIEFRIHHGFTSLPNLPVIESQSESKKTKSEERRRNILGKRGRW